MNFYNNDRNNLIDCAIIKAEVGSGYYYTVKQKDIMEIMNFIKTLYNKLSIPYNRIYLVGYNRVSESSISTKEKIIEQTKNMIIDEIVNTPEGNKISKR